VEVLKQTPGIVQDDPVIIFIPWQSMQQEKMKCCGKNSPGLFRICELLDRCRQSSQGSGTNAVQIAEYLMKQESFKE
jgi:hypothetical protein